MEDGNYKNETRVSKQQPQAYNKLALNIPSGILVGNSLLYKEPYQQYLYSDMAFLVCGSFATNSGIIIYNKFVNSWQDQKTSKLLN